MGEVVGEEEEEEVFCTTREAEIGKKAKVMNQEAVRQTRACGTFQCQRTLRLRFRCSIGFDRREVCSRTEVVEEGAAMPIWNRWAQEAEGEERERYMPCRKNRLYLWWHKQRTRLRLL